VLLIVDASVTQGITITFEEGLGQDGTAINNQYTGISFVGATNGLPWLYSDASTGFYNASSWPSGQILGGEGDYWIDGQVCAWTGEAGANGKIVLTAADATYFQLNYSSYSTLYLEAFDSAGNLITTDSGPANLRFTDNNPNGPGTLRVEAPAGDAIASVLVHDTGNYWVVDNVVTDATGIVQLPSPTPEPSTLVSLATGMLGLLAYAWQRRRRMKAS